MKIKVPISVGELFDKITILQLKLRNIKGEASLSHIQKEFDMLVKIAKKIDLHYNKYVGYKQLLKVNSALWNIEEGKRDHERKKTFGKSFIELARSVYKKNDDRAKIKRKINDHYGSEIIEVKSYKPY